MEFRNEVLLSGKVFDDAKQGSPRAPWRFTLMQGGNKKRNSEERWPVTYYSVVCWPDKCEGSPAEVKKDSFVEASGRLEQRTFIDKAGMKRSTVDLVAATLLIQSKQPKPLTPRAYSGLGITDDDFPQ